MQNKSNLNFSSKEFLNQLRDKEHNAFNSLVNAYSEQLYRTSLGLGFNRNDSRELTQIVWTTLYEIISEFKGKSHIRTFIFGILYNKASEFRREQKKFFGPEVVDDIMNERFDHKGNWVKPPIDPEKFLLGAESNKIIEKCLDSLPLKLKMAFALKEIEGKKNSEICELLNLSYSNLGVIIYRAKNRLRECIEGKAKKM
jgi:RNA polymerase sigma-70 factor (ECF subfamily)